MGRGTAGPVAIIRPEFITFGPVDIAIPDVARILVCRIFRSEPAQYAELLQSTTADIMDIRFPRV